MQGEMSLDSFFLFLFVQSLFSKSPAIPFPFAEGFLLDLVFFYISFSRLFSAVIGHVPSGPIPSAYSQLVSKSSVVDCNILHYVLGSVAYPAVGLSDIVTSINHQHTQHTEQDGRSTQTEVYSSMQEELSCFSPQCASVVVGRRIYHKDSSSIMLGCELGVKDTLAKESTARHCSRKAYVQRKKRDWKVEPMRDQLVLVLPETGRRGRTERWRRRGYRSHQAKGGNTRRWQGRLDHQGEQYIILADNDRNVAFTVILIVVNQVEHRRETSFKDDNKDNRRNGSRFDHFKKKVAMDAFDSISGNDSSHFELFIRTTSIQPRPSQTPPEREKIESITANKSNRRGHVDGTRANKLTMQRPPSHDVSHTFWR